MRSNPGAVSVGRMQRRTAYSTYMASGAWRRRRRAWWSAEVARTGTPVRCAGCGRPWRLDADDLHHLDYSRLGGEAHEDLTALCRPCHEVVHRLLDASAAYRAIGLRAASLHILGLIAQR
ncbi:MAG: HNH endonuclease signature motif containing protein [Microbacterium sp.]